MDVPSQSNRLSPDHFRLDHPLAILDNSETSHKTDNPLFRRPLNQLCSKEKSIRSHCSSPVPYRLGKIAITFFLAIFHRLLPG